MAATVYRMNHCQKVYEIISAHLISYGKNPSLLITAINVRSVLFVRSPLLQPKWANDLETRRTFFISVM